MNSDFAKKMKELIDLNLPLNKRNDGNWPVDIKDYYQISAID